MAYTLSGTHRGDFQGIAASGKKVEARGVQIGRFENGKIVERWGATDELGIMRQIDAAPKHHGKFGTVAKEFITDLAG